MYSTIIKTNSGTIAVLIFTTLYIVFNGGILPQKPQYIVLNKKYITGGALFTRHYAL